MLHGRLKKALTYRELKIDPEKINSKLEDIRRRVDEHQGEVVVSHRHAMWNIQGGCCGATGEQAHLVNAGVISGPLIVTEEREARENLTCAGYPFSIFQQFGVPVKRMFSFNSGGSNIPFVHFGLGTSSSPTSEVIHFGEWELGGLLEAKCYLHIGDEDVRKNFEAVYRGAVRGAEEFLKLLKDEGLMERKIEGLREQRRRNYVCEIVTKMGRLSLLDGTMQPAREAILRGNLRDECKIRYYEQHADELRSLVGSVNRLLVGEGRELVGDNCLIGGDAVGFPGETRGKMYFEYVEKRVKEIEAGDKQVREYLGK